MDDAHAQPESAAEVRKVSAALNCHRCGYFLKGTPETGRAVICPECGAMSSFDPELHAKLSGDDGGAGAFCGPNRILLVLAYFTGGGILITGLWGGRWTVILAGVLWLGAAVTVRRMRPRWFVEPVTARPGVGREPQDSTRPRSW